MTRETLLLIASILILMTLITGCKNNEHIATDLLWFDTKDKAIENGLNQEGVDKSSILASDNVNDETIVFYENHNAYLPPGQLKRRWLYHLRQADSLLKRR